GPPDQPGTFRELPGDLAALLDNAVTVSFDFPALLRRFADAGWLARCLTVARIRNPALDPPVQAGFDPVVADIENVVDPLAQKFLVVAFAVQGLQAASLQLFAHPVARAVTVVASELNISAAAGHVGGDGDGARNAGLGDDVGFLLVI